MIKIKIPRTENINIQHIQDIFDISKIVITEYEIVLIVKGNFKTVTKKLDSNNVLYSWTDESELRIIGIAKY